MHLPAIGNYLAVGGAKLVLIAVSPLQQLFDTPGITHEFCNQQALTIMRNDGFELYAQFLTAYKTELNAGVYWADKGWRNVSHYFVPTSGKGLWQFATAIEIFDSYYQQGITHMHSKNYRQAVFFLGAASHMMQDLCVPHHARAKLFSGHKEYESWAQSCFANYAVENKGLYHENTNAASQLLSNAVVAADLFDWVNLDRGVVKYHDATTILLPLAQRSTSGLFLNFCTEAGKIIEPLVVPVQANGFERSDWRVAFTLGTVNK